MPQLVKSSDFLALRRRRRSDRGPWVAPVGRRDRRPMLIATDTLARRVEPAEVAQARLFEGILQAEFAELHHLAHRMARPLQRQPALNGPEPAPNLPRIHARIDEIQGLLQALRGRFPDSR